MNTLNSKVTSLIGIALVTFIAYLEFTVVNTALPTIQQVFHISILDLQWVTNIYCIVVGSSMVICGRLGDLFGRKLLYSIGILFLIIGSLGAGYSNSFWELIFFRGIQSIGVATAATLGPSLLYSIFKENVNRPMSLYGTIIGVAMSIGPLVGGFIVMHLGWRWLFYINIPILIIAAIFCFRFLPESKSEEKMALDFPGAFLVLATLASLTYGLIQGGETNWKGSLTPLIFLIFLVAIILLIFIENKKAHPILNFHFFKKPIFLLAVLGCSTGGALITTSIFFSPLLLQRVMNYTPKEAGALLLAIPIAIIFFAPFVAKLIEKIGIKYTLLLIPLLGLISSVLHLYFTDNTSLFIIILGFLLAGLSWTLITTATAIGATGSVKPSESGVAVGTTFSFWNISSAINLAMTALIFHLIYTKNQALHVPSAFMLSFRGVFIYTSLVLVGLLLISSLIIYFTRKR